MSDDTPHVLVIKSAHVAFGPFNSARDAEYAAMDYYGTAITGADIRGDFAIVPLCSANDSRVNPPGDEGNANE